MKKRKFLISTLTGLCVCLASATFFTACKEEHKHGYTETITAPTCTEQGFTTHTCACNDSYVDTYVDALGHDFQNYIPNGDATCTENGTETATCSRQGCEEKDTRTDENSALDHEYGLVTYIWNENQCTAERICSHDNTHKEIETVTATYVKDSDATCDIAETGHYQATFENTAFLTQNTAVGSVITGEALGHSYSEVWEKDAKYHWHKANCEHTSEISPKIEHDYGTDNICDTCQYERGIAVTGITLNYTSIAMMVGEVKTLIATITPTDATNKNVMWTVSSSSVVTVDDNGVITAIGDGNAIVYAVTEDGAKMAQCIVVVIDNECEHTTTRTERENEVDSTCNEVGSYDEVVYCSACGDELSRNQKEIAKKETHTPVTDARVEPTFTKTGLTEGSHCGVCGFVIVEQEIIPVKPSKAEISSGALTVNGTNISGKFPYATIEFNFANDISVTNSDTWVLSSDANGEHTIITKKATLTEGDNILYIHVENPDKTVTTYTVNIYRNHMYTVSFDTDGGTSVETQYVEEGYLATEPTTTRTGYTFNSWDYDFATPIIANTTITATWSANTNTKYVVEYYLQNLSNNNYTLDNTRSYQTVGTTDKTASITPETIEHFTLNSSMSELSGNIDGKGDLVLKVYYTRDNYTITTNKNNTKAGTITSGGTYKFDKQITLTATTNDGYTFLGWFNGETKVYNELSYTFNVCETITLTAKWSTNVYNIEYELNGGVNNKDNVATYTIETATFALKTPTKTGYSFNGWFIEETFKNQVTEITLGSFGDVKVYAKWTPANYTVTYNYGYAEKVTTYTYNIETLTFDLITPTRDGYTFNGWYLEETFKNQVTKIEIGSYGDKVYYAKWTANTDTKYTVIYYLQNIDDDNYTSHETVVLEGETDTMAYGETERYAHFTYNASMGLVSGNINGDGSQVLSVYYTRVSYKIDANNNNSKAGVSTQVNGNYRYGKDFTLTATTNMGYTWLGWYEGEILVCENEEFRFNAEKNVTYTAKFALREEMSLFNFTSTETTCIITGIKDKTVTDITIPDCATSIGSSAFLNWEGLTSVTIGNGVTSIGSSAFAGCTCLTNVIMQDGIVSIGKAAFKWCYSLTSIEIPDSVTSIGDDAFCFSYGLTIVVIGDGVTTIGNYAFDSCEKLASVIIGKSVTSIGEGAFSYCDNLIEVVNKSPYIMVEKGSENNGAVGHYALFVYNSEDVFESKLFNDNGYIIYTNGEEKILVGYVGQETDLILPSYITTIEQGALSYCVNVKSVVIVDGVEKIYASAFDNCPRLTSVYYKGTVEEWAKVAIGNIGNGKLYYYSEEQPAPNSECTAFDGNYWYYDESGAINVWDEEEFKNRYSLGLAYTLNNDNTYSVTGIGECTDKHIIIPSTYKEKPVTSIGNSAFYECSSLTSVNIPDSITSIGDTAFRKCSSLTSFEFGDGVISIGIGAFLDCSSLTSIIIPDSVTSIGNKAFGWCEGLTSVVIGNGVISIGHAAFDCCPSLTSVIIPDNVTLIGSMAFSSSSNLTSVVIGNGVTTICDNAFSACCNLTSVFIGKSVTSIDERAFDCCENLTNVYYQGTMEDWAKISIGSDNFTLTSAVYYYYSESEPTTSGNYWHYNSNGEIKIWGIAEELDNPEGPMASQGLEYKLNNDGVSYSLMGIGVCTDIDIIIPSTYWGLPVTSIYKDAFAYNDNITSVIIPDSVISIGADAFHSCGRLTSVVIGDKVTTIGVAAFEYCYKLVEVFNKSSLNIAKESKSYGYVGYYAKDIYTSLSAESKLSNDNGYIIYTDGNEKILICYTGSETDLMLPAYVTQIYRFAFYYCSSLTSVVIPDSVTRIGNYAFSDCSSLTSVLIGDSVTSIGYMAFSWCSSLTCIKYRGTSLQWSAIKKEDDWNYRVGSYTIIYNYTGN